MPEMAAYCGLVCTKCPAYLATQADDDIARQKTADFYKTKFGLTFKPEEINCDGCLSVGGKLIGYCHSCEIRKCAMKKGVTHCVNCDEQPCAKLKKFHEFSAFAKNAFEALSNEKNGN